MIEKFLDSLLAFVFCSMIIAMGAVTWDSLAKNQTDPTLITESISAAIAAHNADPEAHMASGQAIDLHRVNDVLDHPAQSVVPDKFPSANRMLIIPTNGSQDISFDNFTGYNLGFIADANQTSAHSGEARADILNLNLSDLGDVTKDFLLDFMYSNDVNTGTGYTILDFNCVRVKLTKTQYIVGYYYSGAWHDDSPVTYSSQIADKWRFFFSAIDNTMYVYLNGVQISSRVGTPSFESNDYLISVFLDRGTSSFIDVYFGNFNLGVSS